MRNPGAASFSEEAFYGWRGPGDGAVVAECGVGWRSGQRWRRHTPAPVLDLDAMEGNVAAMAAHCRRRLVAEYLGEHWGEPNVIHLD